MRVSGHRGEGAGRSPEEAPRTGEQACEQVREPGGAAPSQVTLEVFTQPRPTSYFSLHLAWIHLYASDGSDRIGAGRWPGANVEVGMRVVVCFGGAASTHEDAHAGGLIVLGGDGVLSLDGPDAEGALPIQHVTEAVQVRWIDEPARDGRADRGRRAFPRCRRSRDRWVPRPRRTPLRHHVRSRLPSRATGTRRARSATGVDQVRSPGQRPE